MTSLPDPATQGMPNTKFPMPTPPASQVPTDDPAGGQILNNGVSDDVQGQTPTLNSLAQPPQPAAGVHKELEPAPTAETATLEETVSEVELEPDLEAAGVQKISETIELSPDMKKMGVQAVGPTQPISAAAIVQLPLTDEAIVVGLHAQIISSLRWLAEWCIRVLKKTHVHLRKMSGKVVRELE